jgi:uncharacterized phage protein (TIGR01671 family)
MRTQKFRVWNNKTKSWIHGPHKDSRLDGVNLFGETILFGELLRGISIEDLNEIIALEFTGLYDKNGKEIFEGDIVKHSYDNEEFTNEVVFEQGYFGLKRGGKDVKPALLWPSAPVCQVVGNIFEELKQK